MIAPRIGTPADLNINREIASAIATGEFFDQCVPLRLRVGIRNAQSLEIALQAPHVRIQQGRFAMVNWNDFVDRISEKKPAIQRRDGSLLDRQKLSVQICRF